MEKNKSVLLLCLVLVLCMFVVGCNRTKTTSNENDVNNPTTVVGEETNQLETSDKYSYVEQNPVVTMEIADLGTIKMELYPQVAPTTVENFISLVSGEFYNGLTFHRTIPGFMAQGGDPDGNGTGGPDYAIRGEFSSNNFKNDISHERGVVSMARANDPDTASSQFFIVTTDSEFLDGNYAAFGRVLEGMDVVDSIVNSEVIRREEDVDQSLYYTDYEEFIRQYLECDRPVNPPVITSATVETFGVEYEEPAKILN